MGRDDRTVHLCTAKQVQRPPEHGRGLAQGRVLEV